jgi:hypothetical protein
MRNLNDRLMPHNHHEFLKLAFSAAEELIIPYTFNIGKKMVEKRLYQGFMKRHPLIYLRTPKSTSMMQVDFYKPWVSDSFAWAHEKSAGMEYRALHYAYDCHKYK